MAATLNGSAKCPATKAPCSRAYMAGGCHADCCLILWNEAKQTCPKNKLLATYYRDLMTKARSG